MNELTPEQKLRESRREQEEAKMLNLYQAVFSTKEGVALLEHWNRSCVQKPVFDLVQLAGHVGYDPINAALNDGSRQFVLKVIATVKKANERARTGEKKKPKVRK